MLSALRVGMCDRQGMLTRALVWIGDTAGARTDSPATKGTCKHNESWHAMKSAHLGIGMTQRRGMLTRALIWIGDTGGAWRAGRCGSPSVSSSGGRAGSGRGHLRVGGRENQRTTVDELRRCGVTLTNRF